MLKKTLFIMTAIFAVIAFQSQAFAVPTSELKFTENMTDEQLQAELAKADDIEKAVAKAIGLGIDAKQVVNIAIINMKNRADAAKIKNAAMASVGPTQRASIATAADKATLEFNWKQSDVDLKGAKSFYKHQGYEVETLSDLVNATLSYLLAHENGNSIIGDRYSNYTLGGGGGSSTSVATASKATQG